MTATTITATGALPHGWRWMNLGEVAQYINGRAFKPEDWRTAGRPIIRIENLSNSRAPFNYFDAEVQPRYLISDGDLLISWSATLDAFIWNRGEAILNQHIFKAIANEDVVTRDYLYYVVRQAMTDIRSRVHGTTMRHITRPEFDAIRVPVPPLDEQRRITAILDEQMTTIERARTAAEQQLEAARALPASYLRAVFESNEAQLWPTKPLDEVADITSGVALGRSLPAEGTRIVAYLRVANVKDGYLALSDVLTTPATEREIAKCRLLPGDVLFTEGGDPDKLGRGTFWRGEIDECIHQNHIFRARFDLNEIDAAFVAAQVGSSYGKRYFFSHAKRTTGIATINRQVLGAFPLRLPPLRVQRSIIAGANETEGRMKSVSASIQETVAAITNLKAATLRAAFTGEL